MALCASGVNTYVDRARFLATEAYWSTFSLAMYLSIFRMSSSQASAEVP